MASSAEVATAFNALNEQVTQAIALLNLPAQPPADDPALQQVLDSMSQASASLAPAVTNFKASHPGT